MKSILLKVLVPLLLLAAGLAGAWLLLRTAPAARAAEVPAFAPWIEILTAEPAPHRIELPVLGEIVATRELTLAAEVGGRVVNVAPGLLVGASFEAGAELVTIEDTDARQAVAAAAAELARARAQLDMAEATADSALADWEALGEGEASPLALHEPQRALARAGLAASEAALAHAETALSRCVIRAPFAGVTLQRTVEVGAVVAPGQPLARLQSAREFEARLPLSLEEFGLLELQFGAAPPPLPVALSAGLGAGAAHWSASLSRIEAALDPRDRTLFARATLAPDSGPPPPAGIFVRGVITGPLVADVTRLPRGALRGTDEVLVVDDDDRLRRRTVATVHAVGDAVFVRGLRRGERVCIVPPPIVAEGMTVRVLPAPAP